MPLPFRSANKLSSHTKERKKILYLTPRFPFPLIGGDRLKGYHLLRHLSETADVDLIALDEWDSGHGANLTEICKLCNDVTVIPFHRSSAWMRVVKSLFTRQPVEYAWYDSPDMRRAVDLALKRRRYDLVVSFFARTGIHSKDLRGTPKILVAEDSRVLAQERASQKFAFTPDYFVRASDRKKLLVAEPELMRKFDLVTFVASPDEDRTLELDPMINTGILSNGVDLNEYRFHTGKRDDAIVFIGELSVYHNRLMVERLVTTIFPLVRNMSPSTKLIIAGNNPGSDLKKLITRTPGAELHASVADIKPFYQRAKVFLHPQEIGAGIQNKLLEALALGAAIVTTPVGASGIAGLADSEHCLIRTSDDELVKAAVDLLHDDLLRTGIAERGRTLVEAQYSWDRIFRDCDKHIRAVAPDFFYEPEPALATAL
jgi:glycosyltransferase involved in cell wall biosynthesis